MVHKNQLQTTFFQPIYKFQTHPSQFAPKKSESLNLKVQKTSNINSARNSENNKK
jgi:hypothetical protein